MKFKLLKYSIIGILFLVPALMLASCSSNSSSNNNSPKENNTIINNLNIDIKNTNFSNVSIDQFTNQNISEIIFKNSISGNKKELSASNVIISNVDKNSQNGTISGNFLLNKYWSNNQLSNSNSNEFSFSIYGFNNNQNPTNDISKGGIFNNLNISSYLEVIKVLDISSNTPIFKITNDYLSSKLSQSVFSSINLSLNSGDEESGEINLKINGTYNNQKIEESNIVINGFKSYTSIIGISSQMNIKKMELNFNEYYSNLQDESSMMNWTANDWMSKYLSSFEINKETNVTQENINLIELYKNNIISNVVFNNVSSLWEDDKSSFNFKFFIYKKKYNNELSRWVNSTEYSTFSFSLENNSIFQAPNNQNCIEYMIKNEISYNNELINSTYASHILSEVKYNQSYDYLTKYININEKFQNKYFQNQLIKFSINDPDYIICNDDQGSLSGQSAIFVNENDTNINYDFNISGFLSSSKFISDNSSVSENFFTAKSGSKAESNIKNEIAKHKDEIDNISINESISVPNNIFLIPRQSNASIYRGTYNSEEGELANNILSEWNINLLGRYFDQRSINVNNNLYNDEFIIKNIQYNFGDGSTATIMKIENSRVSYSVNFTIQIEIESSENSIITINSNFESKINI